MQNILFTENFKTVDNKLIEQLAKMAPIPNIEMLDELAVECMDLQVALTEEPNKPKHKDLIRKVIDKIVISNKFQPIPEFEEG